MRLGEWVCVSVVLHRKSKNRRGEWTVDKVWESKPIEPRIGILIGYRTLSNGTRWLEDEAGWAYEPRVHFRAALVVFSEREKPVYVPLDALEAEHAET